MFYHTESKPQTWRALAVFADGTECLLYVGRSTTQVRAGYRDAYREVLDEEERARVRRVSLQCWAGAPDRGRWIPKATLTIPEGIQAIATGSGDQRPGLGVAPRSAEAPEEAPLQDSILLFRSPGGAWGRPRVSAHPGGGAQHSVTSAPQAPAEAPAAQRRSPAVLPLHASA